MPDHNQDDPNAPESQPPREEPPAYFLPDLTAEQQPEPQPEETIPGGPRLLVWLIVLLVAGAASLIFNLQEAAFLVALSGLFVAAQAADINHGHRPLYWSLTWVVPVGGAIMYSTFAFIIARGEPAPLQVPMVAIAAASAIVSLLTILPLVSNVLVRILFRGQEPSHALRLAARLCLIGFMLALPGWYAFRDTLAEVLENTPEMFEQVGLGSGLIGYVALALAAVGFMVRRDLPATLERLGIRGLTSRDWLMIPLGVLALIGANVGLEALQRVAFPDLWQSDQRISAALAANLTTMQVLMIGLSAGIGEEITLRGALQPKLGVVLTSLLFAALHVQYSWFGMGVIFLFGIILGIIRIRTNTTVVMAIHTLYDVLVIFSI